MRKAAIVLALMLSMVSGTSARPNFHPISWVKHHPELTGAIAAFTVGAIVEEKGVTRCQQGYLEVCNEGYGSRRAFAGFATGMSATFVGVGEACKKSQPHWWFCHAMEFSGSATQTTFGVIDFIHYKPCDRGESACGASASNLKLIKR